MNRFHLCSACLVLLVFQVKAGMTLSGARWLEGRKMELSVRLDPPLDQASFEILSTSVVTLPLSAWKSQTPEVHRDPATGLWLLQVPAENTNTAFYRVVHRNEETERSVWLSEISSDNATLLRDEDGAYPDWIELVNRSETSVSLLGWSLSDDAADIAKWVFPDVSLDPGGHLLVFASGKDRKNTHGELHTSFRIASEGEAVLLSDARGRLVDGIRTADLDPDTSLGRSGILQDQWNFFSADKASPGEANGIGGLEFLEPPSATLEPGMYPGSIRLEMNLLSRGLSVRYTLNGEDPRLNGLSYEHPVDITETSVLRMVSMEGSGRTSQEVTGTYFIGDSHTLAVVSLSAPGDAFEINEGFLYGFGSHMFNSRGTVSANFPYSASNAWKHREMPVSFEFFEPDGQRGFQQTLGVKVFGGWGSRGYPQKSLAFFARSQYGKGKVRYPLFPDIEVDAFESFVLRNSGNDNQSTHQIPPRSEITAFGRRRSNGSYFVNGQFTLMRDALFQRVADRLDVEQQAYRPVVVYLNGSYWGIYNLREKMSEHFLASHHGVDPDEVDLIEGYGSANSGSSKSYHAMRDYMEATSLASDKRYARVTGSYLEASSFIDYHLAVIYFQNFDIGNIKQWRDQNGGKFRWMLYDQDYGFHLWREDVYVPAMRRDFADYDNMFDFYTSTAKSGLRWPNGSGNTMMLRRMLENASFRAQFVNRCADLLNADFSSDRVTEIIQAMAAVIRPEIATHLERWSWPELARLGHGSPFKEEDAPLSKDLWEANIQGLMTYARQRPVQLRQDLMDHFGLEQGHFELALEPKPIGAGSIRVNSISSDELKSSTAIYFKQVPIELEAMASDGFQFIAWKVDGVNQGEPLLKLEAGSKDRIVVEALFERLD
ncbi:CotH kinase family protein [Verrucomicrobia bacterium]|nr:CotH kinase family protein [Verrucomicrobiota bacterium]